MGDLEKLRSSSLSKQEHAAEKDSHSQVDKERRSAMSSARKIWSETTYEPLLLLHSIAHFSTLAVSESLLADKSCLVTLDKPENICEDIINYPDDEIEVQKASSKLQGISTLAANLIPTLLLFYIGPLSDRYGRKPFLYLSLVSKTISMIIYFFISIYMYSSPVLAIVAPFIYSLGAGMSGFQMLIFACVADVTNESNRTYRLGILKIFMAFGSPIGRLIGGQVFAVGGYVSVFGMAVGLLLICLAYLAYSPESVAEDIRDKRKLNLSSLLKIPAELGVAIFRKDGPRRAIVFLNLLAHGTLFIAKDPQYFLFFKFMLDWDATVYSNWLFYRDFVKAIATVVLMPVLVRRFSVPDVALGMIGAASLLYMELAHSQIVSPALGWIVWLSPLLGMLELFSHLAARTIISKCSDGNTELGRVFAGQAILDAFASAMSGPLYGWVYSSTVDTLPVAQFLVAAGFLFVAFVATRVSDVFIKRKEALAAER